jgi:hypothetical protein
LGRGEKYFLAVDQGAAAWDASARSETFGGTGEWDNPDVRRPRLSYANVVSTLALFLALGGASYAALTLPRDSVGAAQLRDGAVTLPKLAFPLAMATASVPHSVEVGAPSPVCGSGPAICSPPAPMPSVVASVTMRLVRPAMVLILGTSTLYQPGNPRGEADSLSLGLASEDVQSATLGTADGFLSTVSFTERELS